MSSRIDHDRAFTALFERLRGRVLALCLHVCGSAAAAEDAVQETFLAVHRLLPSFRGESSVDTWIYRIALRVSLRAKSRTTRDVPLELAAEPSRVEAHEAREEARLVLSAVAALPAEQRAVVALFAVDGLGHAEIAEVLGVPVGTVWSRLHSARRKLNEALRSTKSP